MDQFRWGGSDLASKLTFIDSNASEDYDSISKLQALVTAAGANAGEWKLADTAVGLVAYGDVANGSKTFSLYKVTGGSTDTWENLGTFTANDADAILVGNFDIS